ncbi:MAG: TlpA family protein disulfide reductase [Azonexus sp.]|nr:TlpA disulfide reductase family protein [Azonexus sp.]MCK6412304.1 TlpA family protein disulfide reductase [Azonexus sp.]
MNKRRFLAGLFCLCCLSTVNAADEQPSAAPLFAATLSDIDDKPVALERFRGKPLIVNFWARWCGPCRAEIPELIKFRQAHKGKLEVLGIGIEDKAEPAREFAKAYEMDYPVFVAKDQGIPLMKELGNSRAGLPYTLFIDRHGQVVQRKMGTVRKADLEAIEATLFRK